MNKRKKFSSSGITLIALVISIIVMLILAGVSLNATIGDNGIITQAQSATYLQSCAVLEEYLNQIYVNDELGDIISANDDGSIKSNLEKIIDNYSNWFYSQGARNYIIQEYSYVDSNGNTQNGFIKLRLIRKKNLPNKIKNQISGGDAVGISGNIDSTDAYEQLKDVYGVTGDLKVYYCEDGIENIKGADFSSSATSDGYDGTKTMYNSNSSLAKAIANTNGTEPTDLNMQDLNSIKELIISNDIGIKNLENLYDLPNLERLTLTNYQGSLKGIEKAYKLKYIFFNNSDGTQNIDFTGFSGVNKLTEIKFLKPDDIEFSKMCDEMSKTNYESLDNIYLIGRWGYYWGDYSIDGNDYGNQGLCELTSIGGLSKLTDVTKKSIKRITIASTKISSLNGLENFNNIVSARLSSNYLLNVNELSSMTKLSFLDLSNNSPLEDITGIKELKNMSTVYFRECFNLNNIISVIKNSNPVYVNANSCNLLNFNDEEWKANDSAMIRKLSNVNSLFLPSKYNLIFSNRESIKVSSSATWEDVNVLKGKSTLKYLSLSDNKNLTDENIQELLLSLPNIKNINLDNTNVASLNFANSKTNINRISFESTIVTDITPLYNCTDLGFIRFNNSKASVILYKDNISDTLTEIEKNAATEYNDKIISIIEKTYNKLCMEDDYGIMGHGGGFCCLATTYFNQINKLKNLTKFGMRYYGANNFGFDFSNTSLKEIYMQMTGGYTIKVPKTVERIYSTHKLYYQADEITNIKYLGQNGASLLKCPNINTVFNESQNGCTVSFCSDAPPNFEQLEGYLGDFIGTFTYSKSSGGIKYGTFSSSIVSTMINCNSIYVSCRNVSRLDGTDFINYTRDFNLTLNGIGITNFDNVNSAVHLKNLNLTNNKIVDVSFFLNNYANSKIESLTLSNNALENYSTYRNEAGTTVTENTTSILAKLPNLKYVNLSGNENLTDFSGLKSAGFIETGDNTKIFTKQ